MLPYKYAYILGTLLICFPIWLLLFLRRKDLRKEILFTSLVGGFFGPVSQLIYTKDYWKPELFSNHTIGIEDFLFGFFIAGIAASIYEEVYGKRFAKRTQRNTNWHMNFISLVVVVFGTFFILTLSTNVNSIYASMIAFLVGTSIIFFKRRDLAKDTLFSGLFLAIFGLITYTVLLALYPDLITRWWFMDNISGVFVLGIPIEEIMWGFTGGMFIGPFYEFIVGLKFRK